MGRRLPFLRALLLLLVLSTDRCVAAKISNSFYFSFPVKSDFVPEVRVGDVVNVSWVDSFPNGQLMLRCNQKTMRRVDKQPRTGFMLFTVNSTWSTPCSWQLADGTDSAVYIDSGMIDVLTDQAFQKPTIWSAQQQNSTCTAPIQDLSPDSAELKCDSSYKRKGRQSPELKGAVGIGVGIVIGFLITVICAGGWLLWQRRRLANSGKIDQYLDVKKQMENEIQPAETRSFPTISAPIMSTQSYELGDAAPSKLTPVAYELPVDRPSLRRD